MRHRGLRRRMLWASAALAVLVAVAFVPLLHAVAQLRDSERAARMSERAVGQANEAEKLLLDAETGVRGFVITRDPRFLAPYRSARLALGAQTRNLVQDVQDDPAQEQRARIVDRQARAYVEDYSPRIVALARRDPDAAARLVATGDGKGKVDTLRSRFARITAVEELRSRQRTDRADAAARRALEIGIASIAAALALVVLFGLYLGRAVAAPVRRLADAASGSRAVPRRARPRRWARGGRRAERDVQRDGVLAGGEPNGARSRNTELEEQKRRLAARRTASSASARSPTGSSSRRASSGSPP